MEQQAEMPSLMVESSSDCSRFVPDMVLRQDPDGSCSLTGGRVVAGHDVCGNARPRRAVPVFDGEDLVRDGVPIAFEREQRLLRFETVLWFDRDAEHGPVPNPFIPRDPYSPWGVRVPASPSGMRGTFRCVPPQGLPSRGEIRDGEWEVREGVNGGKGMKGENGVKGNGVTWEFYEEREE